MGAKFHSFLLQIDMRVLVTGNESFVGSHIQTVLEVEHEIE